jgi:hypothetical protein
VSAREWAVGREGLFILVRELLTYLFSEIDVVCGALIVVRIEDHHGSRLMGTEFALL